MIQMRQYDFFIDFAEHFEMVLREMIIFDILLIFQKVSSLMYNSYVEFVNDIYFE